MTLFRQTNRGARRVGSRVTRANGRWAILVRRAQGTYFAVVSARTLQGAGGVTCLRAESARLRIRPRRR